MDDCQEFRMAGRQGLGRSANRSAYNRGGTMESEFDAGREDGRGEAGTVAWAIADRYNRSSGQWSCPSGPSRRRVAQLVRALP